MKKFMALCLASVMLLSLVTAAYAENTAITLLNSKGEIQSALEEVAKTYEAQTGVKVEVLACGTGESPYTKITSMYNSGTAPTMAMLDPNDIMSLAQEKAVDLTAEAWTKECETSLMPLDGKVYAFPFCVEGRGLIYNKSAIEKALGTPFDPATITSYDALKALLESLRVAGMENPVVISKEDWSLGAHQFGMVYDAYDGTSDGAFKLIAGLKDGSIRIEDVDRFQQLVSTLDLLLEYNVNKADPLGALYEQDPIFVAEKEAAMWFNGNWAWPNLAEAGATAEDGYGFLPYVLGNDTADFANNGIDAAPTKCVMIDREQASAEQIQAAKDFLTWLVYDENGQKALTNTCNVIPACTNNPNAATDPLGQDIQAKMAAGKTFSSAYTIKAPSDHWSKVGAEMQKYIAGKQTSEELAAAVDAYWASQK